MTRPGARQCNSLESDPVKESLVANAPVVAIWIIDSAFKQSSICSLVPLHNHPNHFGCHPTMIKISFGFLQSIGTPALPSHQPIVELSLVAGSVRPSKRSLTVHFPLHKLTLISADQCHLILLFPELWPPIARDLQSCTSMRQPCLESTSVHLVLNVYSEWDTRTNSYSKSNREDFLR